MACENAAGLIASSQIDERNMIDAIYDNAFLSTTGSFPGIKRKNDGHVLTYYVNAPPGASCTSNVSGLLSDGDGRCGAWAQFFIQIIKIQGITGSHLVALYPKGGGLPYYITSLTSNEKKKAMDAVKAKYPGKSGSIYMEYNHFLVKNDMNFNDITWDAFIYMEYNHFLVKNWGGVSNGDLIELPLAYNKPDDNDGYETAKSDFGKTGISGQGNVPEPRSIFLNHAVVFYGNKTYDPSYGKKYDELGIGKLEQASCDAVKGCIIRVAHSQNDKKFYFYVLSKNTASIELDYQIIN